LSSSRIRLYLDLKLSPLELSRWRKLPYGQFIRYKLTPAMYLKEMANKWSIFEKPYLDDDSYRAMQFKPFPSWPTSPPELPRGSIIPEEAGLWIFRWDKGICWLGTTNPVCGEPDTLRISLGLVPPGHDYTFGYDAVVIEGDIGIHTIEYEPTDQSATIHFMPGTDYEGPATICAGANASGQLLQEVVVKSPFTGPTGILQWQRALALPPAFQLSTTYYEGISYDCGCQDFDVVCCNDTLMDYDEASSVSLMARNSSGTVYITDSGRGNPYIYNISGTGFWFDAYYTITTIKSDKKYVTVYADNTACGKATILITGCGGNSITGEIMCTEGQWEPTDTHEECLIYHVGAELSCDNFVYGNKKYKVWINCYDCNALGYCDGHGCDTSWAGDPQICVTDCVTGTGKPCSVVNCWAAGKVTYGDWTC